jgi:hypothetical protein
MQATSYCETVAVLFEWARDAVPGLPAYTSPAWPLALNGEPGALADEPGVTGFDGPQVLAGAPRWPVDGFCVAKAATGVAMIRPAEHAAASTYFRIALPPRSVFRLRPGLLPGRSPRNHLPSG